jgi:lysophospholipase L1-like esterase
MAVKSALPTTERPSRLGAILRWALRAALATLSIAAALLVGELWARAVEVAPPLLEPAQRPLCQPVPGDGGLRYRLIPARRTQQELSAWADRPARTVTYSVTPQSFRGEPLVTPKPTDEFRIVVVGDSFTFGSAVDDAETFPAQLERDLRREFGTDRIRVINLGVPGYQIRQERATLRRRVPHFEPDLVLLNLYVNDPIPTAPSWEGRAVDPDAMEIPQLRWVERLGLTAALWAPTPESNWQGRVGHWICERSELAYAAAYALYQQLSPRGNMLAHQHRWREDGPGFGRILACIDEARELAREHDFEFHVSMYPMLFELDDYPLSDAHTALEAACAERGVPFHDLLPVLVGRDPMSLWAHERDHHPNALCHGLVAGRLAEGLHPSIPR